jgi:pimeloyl-ACP methyl ester carboxylesterase
VIFVHGSLSDGGYWADQIDPFAKHYRAIAYSRRYNYPNVNPARPGYSAIVDAEDLAGFIHTLHLGKVVVIGHSYGALTALFLAAKHPELVRALVLAEPPAISLLAHLPGGEAKTGKAIYDDIQRRMVAPMQQAFRRGDRDAGIAAFIDYVFSDPQAWDKMPEAARAETLRDAQEWDVMMTTGTLFPEIEASTIRRITAPVLLLSGAKSYPFLGLITEELARLLPNRETIVLPDAGHQMWDQAPELCRKDVEAFLARIGVQSSAIEEQSPSLLEDRQGSVPWLLRYYFSSWGTSTEGAASPSDGISHLKRSVAAKAPADSAAMKEGTSTGRIPANVFVRERAMVTAGLAKDVDAVNQ